MKKFLTIMAVALLAIMSIGVVSLAFIKTDFNQVELNNISQITLLVDGKGATLQADSTGKEKEMFDKVINLYKKGTKDAVIGGLFSGAYSAAAKPTIDEWRQTPSISSGTYLIIYYKSDSLPTIKLNGKVYESEAENGRSVNYEKAIIKLDNTNTLTTAETYLVEEDKDGRAYKLESISKHFRLVKYFEDLQEEIVFA